MFGKLLSTGLRIVTLPIDAVNIAQDVVIGGGDGSKRSRNNPNDFNPLSDMEQIRDELADSIDSIDD